jgi:hypothetical protein
MANPRRGKDKAVSKRSNGLLHYAFVEARWATILGVVIGTVIGVGTFIHDQWKPGVPDQVAERIASLQTSINSLKETQRLMATMKDDLERANLARQKIEEDLQNAEKLKSLSDDELSAITAVLKQQSWFDTVKAFLSGVLTSLVGSVLYAWWTNRRTENNAKGQQ